MKKSLITFLLLVLVSCSSGDEITEDNVTSVSNDTPTTTSSSQKSDDTPMNPSRVDFTRRRAASVIRTPERLDCSRLKRWWGTMANSV